MKELHLASNKPSSIVWMLCMFAFPGKPEEGVGLVCDSLWLLGIEPASSG